MRPLPWLVLLLAACEAPPMGESLQWTWGDPDETPEGDGDPDDPDDDDEPSAWDWRDELPEAGREASITEWVRVPPEVSDDVWFARTPRGACIARSDRSSLDGVYCVDEEGNVEETFDADEVAGLAAIGSTVYVLRYGTLYDLESEEEVYDGDFIGLGAGDQSLWGVDADWRLVQVDPDTGRVVDDTGLPDDIQTWLDPETEAIGVAVDDGEVWLSVQPEVDDDHRWLLKVEDGDVRGAYSWDYRESEEPVRPLGLAFDGNDLVFAEDNGYALRKLEWVD